MADTSPPGQTAPRGRRIDKGAIFETLRYRISTLEYPPGTALKEIELSQEFGVSRTPIRQALQRLEVAGLVRPVIGHGTMVTSVDLMSVRHLLDYRLKLALLLGDFLAEGELASAVPELRQLQARNASLAEGFSEKVFAEISHDCRWLIAERIANPFVAQTWIDTYYLASRVWFLCLPAERSRYTDLQSDELAALCTAFASGDPKAVATAVHETLKTWVDEIWSSIADGRVPIELR